jgi:hypothetical protein
MRTFIYCLSVLSWNVWGYASATKPCVNSPQNRQCWGEFDINTDYYEVTPDTGRTVEVHAHNASDSDKQYYLSVDNTTLAPDGIPRQMLVFNNSYPGPLIEANWGDWIVVHITNNLPNNGLLQFANGPEL